MKKIYVNPEMVIVKVETMQMLANSLKIEGEGSQNLARDFDFNDDEE